MDLSICVNSSLTAVRPFALFVPFYGYSQFRLFLASLREIFLCLLAAIPRPGKRVDIALAVRAGP